MWRMRDDEGAFAVVFAIVMTFAMFGLTALVIDVGGVYAESRQLQNAADSAALAAAADCAVSLACSGGVEAGTVAPLANANSNDGASTVQEVCGRGRGGLSSCAAAAAAPTHWDCRPAPSTGNYVQVRTRTRTAGGSGLLPAHFVRAIPGLSGYAGTAVKSCARAAWGPPGAMTVALPLTVSLCDYNRLTAGGTAFEPASPGPPAPALHLLYGNGTALPTPCGAAQGGFGWLAGTSCSVSVMAARSYAGATSPGRCGLGPFLGKVVDIPVFQLVTGAPRRPVYLLRGFAPFVLAGYHLSPAVNDGRTACPGGPPTNACITGFFTRDLVVASGDLGTGPALGTVVVRLTN